jgi:hypothetical protein
MRSYIPLHIRIVDVIGGEIAPQKGSACFSAPRKCRYAVLAGQFMEMTGGNAQVNEGEKGSVSVAHPTLCLISAPHRVR